MAPSDDIILSELDRHGAIDSIQAESESVDHCEKLEAETPGKTVRSTISSVQENPENSLDMSLQDRYPVKRISGDGTSTKSYCLEIEIGGLVRPSVGTRERWEESEEQAAVRLEKMKGAVRTLLECVGEDPNREGLLDTPSRYAKALLFLTKGYQANMNEVVNNALFCEGHDEMVIVKDIDIYSLCEHHLMPFTGKESPRRMYIGYIPSDTVVGLSKLSRLAEIFSCRLQIQERLTKEVAQAIMEVLKPQGVAVVIESSHLCMVMRGVGKASATTLTSCALGTFHHDTKTRQEFLCLIGMNR